MLGTMDDGVWRPRADFERLFRADRYRFEFGVRPAEGNWFHWTAESSDLLNERRRLLADEPDRYAPWSAEADPVLGEALDLFGGGLPEGLSGGGRGGAIRLAGGWEPDFVLLRQTDAAGFRMIGGCVCDPSWWSPSEKLGLTLREIHAPVPTLNAELGARIDRFVDRLPSGETYVRENWGVAAVPDRNLHPARNRPRLVAGTPLESCWLRVEYQAFRALPRTRGLLFVIWLQVYPMSVVLAEPNVAAAFRRQLASMPLAIAEYKGLGPVIPGWLDAPGGR